MREGPTKLATLSYATEGEIARIVLTRPEALNAYSVQMRDDLYQVLTALHHDPEPKALLIRGAGPAFCAGADLTEFGTAPGAFAARRIRFARDVWATLRNLPIPTVAAMHGHSIGTGLEIGLLCNLRLAADSLRARMPEALLGLLPAACGTQLLPRIAGDAAAGRLFYMGETLDAEQALAAGLVDRVVPATELEAEVEAALATLAAQPRERLVRATRLLRLADRLGPAEAVTGEARLARAGRTSGAGRASGAGLTA